MNRIRLTSPTAVIQMASVNHVEPVRTSHSAMVELDGFVYFWAA